MYRTNNKNIVSLCWGIRVKPCLMYRTNNKNIVSLCWGIRVKPCLLYRTNNKNIVSLCWGIRVKPCLLYRANKKNAVSLHCGRNHSCILTALAFFGLIFFTVLSLLQECCRLSTCAQRMEEHHWLKHIGNIVKNLRASLLGILIDSECISIK